MIDIAFDAVWVVVKSEPSLYFRQLCNLCMSVRAFFPSLRSKLIPRFIPNPNECMHERSKSERTLMHKSQRFGNKADDLYLTTPAFWLQGDWYCLWWVFYVCGILLQLTLSSFTKCIRSKYLPKHDSFRHFFSNQVVPVWNLLPESIVSSSSVSSFKIRLK